MSEKQEATDRLTRLLGHPRVDITGRQRGTVPASVFREAARRAGVAHTNRPATAQAVIESVGHKWDPGFDSRESARDGGGNVTVPGLWALGDALEALLAVSDTAATPTTSGDPVLRVPVSGQSRMLDPVRRKKIEMAAQNWLMGYYEDRGWQVVDTHIGSPYDAVATKDGETRYLEAKGTMTDGATVIVTRNEVEWVRTHPNECILGIWSGIVFDDDGEVAPGAGMFSIFDWRPGDHLLTPITYDLHIRPTSPQVLAVRN